MKKIMSLALIFLSTLNYFFVHAQTSNITINGKVTSFEESLALEGVAINVKGTTKNSGTQADGTFSISVSPDDKILVFKLEGYQTEEVTISSKKDYDIVLKRNGNITGSFTKEYSQDKLTDNTFSWRKEDASFNHYTQNPTALFLIR